jgi:hypothetical protein
MLQNIHLGDYFNGYYLYDHALDGIVYVFRNVVRCRYDSLLSSLIGGISCI